ncbi:Myc-type, basic helix-loop-helix (bHLH) domain protein [Kalmanozyma brasiliensis GHG001]|uniref:BHLH domain-containing protein n=1 Tax=Kalmanozyma brasiliensis (strain GHG001) TaxID=1365824 RepID=V5E5F0_KALBG|nr:Myc-type, basic helix-loop-helix (bHLH) domain protein [Kalmanozyma brasiliensis GHG001]EST05441.1 Myc-type, basic helix-loop-helix (bHLH) domain protein [Kalmanozyma brasiliensis GHG001]
MMQNSPASSHNPFPSSSTPNSFMDTFDFGNADFSTANSGLEDLNIFPSSNAAPSISSHHNGPSEAGSAPVSHHPSPSAAFAHATASSDPSAAASSSNPHSAAGMFLNSASHASSPLAYTRNRFDNNASASPQAGPSDQGHIRPPSAAPTEMAFSGSHFSDHSRGASAAQSQINDQDGQMPQLSISDLQRMLMERERTERIQNMQTALLKQQLDQLSRLQQHQSQMQAQQQQQQQQHASHQQQQQQQHQQNVQGAGPSSNPQLNLSGSAGQLSPGQQQSLLMALQNAFAAGNNPSAHHNVLQAAQYQQQQQQQQQQSQGQGQDAWQQQQPQQQMSGAAGQGGASGDQSNVLAQYGLITPIGSGPFNGSACPPGSANFMSPLAIQPNSQPGSVGLEHRRGPDYLNNYTPLESPAVTPASVFSTGSTGIVMSELFSPLTSPALGPQPPSLGEMMLPPVQMQLQQHHQQQQPGMHGSPAVSAVNNFTPTASPLALIAKGSSKIRKNRSTTAESRANKVRPSPLMKPVAGPSLKKKKDSLASPSTATPLINGNGHANGGSSGSGSRRTSITTAPDAVPGLHSRHQSADVAQSEGTSSTPSPIDLSGGGAMPPPSGPTNKILTPSSIMGIRSSPGSSANSPNRTGPAALSSALKAKARGDDLQQQQQMMMQQPMGMPAQSGAPMYPAIAPFPSGPGGPKVTFNLPPQMNGMPIQPGGLSQADRDAWMTYKSAGGLESRRTSHKAAEQKRRDSLKFCFDELRGLLPAITLDEDAPNGSLLGPDGTAEDREAEHFEPNEVGDPDQARAANKAISKVALLRHSNEYLIRMKKRLERRDQALLVCRREVQELREKLGLPASEDPSVTGKGPPLGWTDDALMGYDLSMGDEVEGVDSPEGKMDQTA